MSNLRIEAITSTTERRKLSIPFKTAQHTVTTMDAVLVTVRLSDGSTGVGAATPNAVVTGDTLTSLHAVIDEVLTPALLHADFARWEDLLASLDHAIHGNSAAKAGVEIALWDLRAQQLGVPLYELLGGDADYMVTDWTVGIADEDVMRTQAQRIAAAGFNAVKIKVGGADLATDLDHIQAIAAAVGPKVKLRLDANQGWTVRQAQRAIQAIAALHLPVEFVEQPVLASDRAGLAAVTASSPLPIMADEALFSPADAQELLRMHACDYLNIKLMKTGGLAGAERINAIAELNGVQCMIGCMIESRIGIAAAVAFAAAHRNVVFADLDAAFMLKEPETGGFTQQQNALHCLHVPGLGFERIKS
ncbi:dipeptide epimerase [Lacticaseibacillus zhaodongensis]|uniref:dipeptide epimerase n=1 Tax=Lacticaseibacillus zhaodongensis TaxID=2668065 RepID=UPI0012D2A67E|nr:dipeptide epimerase [Lacticaseibacillus zhaodongensis]